jgi:hypothetical protein
MTKEVSQLIHIKFTKKPVLTGVSIVAVLAIAVTAFAYWTTSGSGSGSATAASSGTEVTVSGNPSNAIYPGGSVPVTTTVTNPGSTQQRVANLHVTISIDATHAGNGCSASWLTYKADSESSGDSNPHTVALNADLAPSGTTTVAGHVFMADTSTNQDACKSATINLAYAVDNNS